MAEHHYQIAGFHFCLDVSPACEPLRLKASFGPFKIPAQPGEVARFHIVPEATEPPPDEPFETLFIDCESWRFGRLPSGRLRMDISYQPRDFWQPAGHFAPDFSEGVLYPKKIDAETPAPYTLFFPVDEQIFLHRMGRLGGALIHGCGIEARGRVGLFCGKSGAGKSTTAKLWQQQGHTLLNDDRIVVHLREGIPMGGATPWHGTEPSVHPALLPLAGIFHLHQAPENRVQRLSAKTGFLKLMSNLIGPFDSQPAMQSILDACAEITSMVPSYDLYFRPDAGAVDVARAVLTGG